jgi:hypothetical protein
MVTTMNFYQHNDKYYIIHRQIRIADFTDKEGKVDLDLVKEGRDSIFKVDHVLRNETHFLFAETIQDAEIIEEMVEETHSE